LRGPPLYAVSAAWFGASASLDYKVLTGNAISQNHDAAKIGLTSDAVIALSLLSLKTTPYKLQVLGLAVAGAAGKGISELMYRKEL
jgi:hypothetical protein